MWLFRYCPIIEVEKIFNFNAQTEKSICSFDEGLGSWKNETKHPSDWIQEKLASSSPPDCGRLYRDPAVSLFNKLSCAQSWTCDNCVGSFSENLQLPHPHCERHPVFRLYHLGSKTLCTQTCQVESKAEMLWCANFVHEGNLYMGAFKCKMLHPRPGVCSLWHMRQTWHAERFQWYSVHIFLPPVTWSLA